MLSAPILTSPNTAPMTGTGLDPLLPAAADGADAQSVEAMPEAAPFGEQLGAALVLPETLAPELTGEDQPARDGQEQAEPNAEAWLLAMLDQQQLQLQARDTQTPAPTNPVAVVSVPVAPAMLAAVTVDAPAAPAATAMPIGTVINATPALRTNQAQVMATKPGVSQDESILQSKVAQQDQSLPDTSVAPKAADFRSSDNSSNAAVFTASATAALSSNPQPQSLQSQPLSQSLQSQPLPEASLGAELTGSLQASPLGVTSASAEKLSHTLQTQLNQAPEAKWGEQLLHTLRDQVQVQIAQKIQNATIRLDPPELGSLEIYISHEAGRLTVHITASQADVARLIQHTSDRLRQELAGSNFTQVNVQTSAEGQSGQQQSRERQRFGVDENILANEQPLVNTHQPQRRPGDVLVSV